MPALAQDAPDATRNEAFAKLPYWPGYWVSEGQAGTTIGGIAPATLEAREARRAGGPDDGAGRVQRPDGSAAAPPPPSGGGGRRVLLVSAAVVVLLALVGAVVYFGISRFGPQSTEASGAPTPAAGAAQEPPAAAPAEEALKPSASVPIPSIGPTIPVGPTSGFVVVSPNGRQVYVANRNAGVVTVVDTAVNKVTATIPVSAGPPQFLAFSPTAAGSTSASSTTPRRSPPSACSTPPPTRSPRPSPSGPGPTSWLVTLTGSALRPEPRLGHRPW